MKGEKEREAVETMIAGVLHMHDAKHWTQAAPPANKTKMPGTEQ